VTTAWGSDSPLQQREKPPILVVFRRVFFASISGLFEQSLKRTLQNVVVVIIIGPF
jgi:hypothetical protein